MARDRQRLGRWATSGAAALFDQALTSGAGFALNLLLAMWLPPAEYGAFAVGFSIFLILSGIHNSLLLEPVSVLGPSRHAGWLASYFRSQVTLHFILTVPIGIVLAVAGLALQIRESTGAAGRCLVGLALAFPLLLLYWTLRRFQYVNGTPGRATAGAIAYAASLLGMVLIVRWGGVLSPALGFAAMGAAGLIACAALRVPPAPARGDSPAVGAPEALGARIAPDLRSLLGEQWRYGRWMLAASILSAAGLQLYSLICAATVGLEAAGTLRAMEILMLPMAQGITAIATLALPRLASDHGRGDWQGMLRRGHSLSFALAAGAILYEVILVVWHGDLERLLYGGRYAEQSALIPVLGLVPILIAASSGFTLMLKAAQRPAHYVVSGVVASAIGLPLNFLLGMTLGLPGFAWSLVLTYLASAVTAIELYRRWVRPGLVRDRAAVDRMANSEGAPDA